jgi:hypothetical protein
MKVRRVRCLVLGHKWASYREPELILATCERCGTGTDALTARQYGDAFGSGGSAGGFG